MLLCSSAAAAGGRGGAAAAAAARGRGRGGPLLLLAACPSLPIRRSLPRDRRRGRRRGSMMIVPATAGPAGGEAGGAATATVVPLVAAADAAPAPPTAATAAAAAPLPRNSNNNSSAALTAVPPLYQQPSPPSPPSSSNWTPVLAAALVGAAVGVAGAWAALAAQRRRRNNAASDDGGVQQQQEASAPSPSPAAPAVDAPPPPTATPSKRRRPAGVSDAMRWYRRLSRVHYLEVSRDDGPVTRIAATELGPDVSEALRLDTAKGDVALLAFQDPADAEFALACMMANKGKGGRVTLASAAPAELESKLKPGQALFVLPSGRLPIKVVSSEAGLRQLLKIALLQDVADRAGAVIPMTAPAAPAAVEAEAVVVEAPSPRPAQAAPASPPPRRAAPPKPPTPAPAPAAAVPPPPPAPAAPTAPAPRADPKAAEEDEDEQPFAPVTLAPAAAALAANDDADADRRLLDDYYALEQSWAADRVANVASAARAQIDDALRSIDRSIDNNNNKVDQTAADRSVDRPVDDDRSVDDSDKEEESRRSIDRPESRSTSTKKQPIDDNADAETKSTVVSKGTRKKREGEEPPPKLSPEQLQRSVLAAMKEIDPSRDDRDKKSGGASSAPKPLIGGGDDDDLDNSKWWRKRLRALYLPTVQSPGAGAGFLQVDISSDGEAKDVRVISFADRYDAMACAAVMAEIDSFKLGGSTFSVAALPTEKVEHELRAAYLRQKADGGSASAPAGVLVFRRGKLQIRVGMSADEFVRAIVLSGAAQVSLLNSGFQF